jgi:hypothetical protein
MCTKLVFVAKIYMHVHKPYVFIETIFLFDSGLSPACPGKATTFT